MEQIQSYLGMVTWDMVKEIGVWVALFVYFTALVQSSIFAVTGVLGKANGYVKEDDAAFPAIIVYTSMLWALFITVKFF